ncbi:MAG: hypothetical protein WAL30_06395 [Candidatus Aquirickettsiella sp.]
MKLKQALVIGFTSTVLALPAIAAKSASDLNSSLPANADQPAAVVMPAMPAKHHPRKDHKKVSMEMKTDAKQAKDSAKLDELNALNSEAAGKAQPEKNSIKS